MDVPEEIQELANAFNGSYWNTRIIKMHVDGKYDNGEEYHETYMGIFEVYYDKDNKPIAWTEDPISITFDDKDEFGDVLGHILDANDKTILEVIDGNIVDTGILLKDLKEDTNE